MDDAETIRRQVVVDVGQRRRRGRRDVDAEKISQLDAGWFDVHGPDFVVASEFSPETEVEVFDEIWAH